MTGAADQTSVRKSVTVRASQKRAFQVFTEGFDTWWPRGHHIGKAPPEKFILETREGGRCYTRQTDGTDCDWGRILVWDPYGRFVMAWQVSPTWEYEPDLTKSSEIEIQFVPLPDGTTRVDLEHRCFERHGEAGAMMRQYLDAPNAWEGTLECYRVVADEAATREVTE